MGRNTVGSALGGGIEGPSEGAELRRGGGNAGSFGQNRDNLDSGAGTRFKRKFDLPSIGDRFGSLVVTGFNNGPAGGVVTIRVQCDCGAAPHAVYGYNLRKGRSTACSVCARIKTGAYRKQYLSYAYALDDTEHRRRLLNRLNAAITRCHNENSKKYAAYGGRGIRVCQQWRDDRGAFLQHVVTLPGWDNPDLEMDRTDNSRGYEPGNIRFVTKLVNNGNRRTIPQMEQRIRELEARVRHLECRAAQPLHGGDL